MQRDLAQLVDSIKNKNFDSLNKERQVETSIVIPLLESLGWDNTIEDEVKVQSGIGKGRSDIELRTKGLCKVVIDTKKGKVSLVSREFERQLMSYAGGVNDGEPSDLAVLTNGKDWRFYLPSIDGGYNKKNFYNIDFSKQSPKEIISIFNELLLKINIINGSSFNRAISINEQRLKPEVIKHDAEIKEIETTKITKEYSQNYLSLDSNFTKKTIESYCFNGSIYSADSWKGLLAGILDNIYTLHKKDFDKVLGVTGGHGRIYFSQNPDDVNFPLKIKDTDIYVDTKLSANNIARLCSDIIYEFGYSDNDLKIKIITSGDKEIISQPNIVEQTSITAKPIMEEIATTPILEEQITEKGKKERYGEYASAIRKLLPNINKWITEAQDGIIRLKTSDIAKDLGKDFVDKSPTSIYWGLRYVLFNEGIYVGTGTTKSGEKLLLLREKTPKDKLPPSLASYLKEEKEEEKGDTIELNNRVTKDVDIPIIDIKEDKNKIDKGTVKKERYGKYVQAIFGHIVWIKERIANSQNGIVTIKVRELAKKMGSDFEKKSDASIYWALKYVLFYEGIFVDMGTHDDGEKILKMRTKVAGDELPPSLAKFDNE